MTEKATDAKPTEARTMPPPATDTVTFLLNDKEVVVRKGTTVMEAADRAGVYIPHFCWRPGLSIAGVCRFCMVKVDNRPKLEIACNLTGDPGDEGLRDTSRGEKVP